MLKRRWKRLRVLSEVLWGSWKKGIMFPSLRKNICLLRFFLILARFIFHLRFINLQKPCLFHLKSLLLVIVTLNHSGLQHIESFLNSLSHPFNAPWYIWLYWQIERCEWSMWRLTFYDGCGIPLYQHRHKVGLIGSW